MKEMKNLLIFLMLILSVSACGTTSKTVNPSIIPEAGIVALEERSLPESLADIKVSYSDITNLIGEFLDIQSIETPSGQPKFLGVSENALVTLEIIGEKEDVEQASMKVFYPEDIEVVNAELNNAMMIRFLKNSAPEFAEQEWSNKFEEMINRFYLMQPGDVEEDEIMLLGGNVIRISYDKNTSSITSVFIISK